MSLDVCKQSKSANTVMTNNGRAICDCNKFGTIQALSPAPVSNPAQVSTSTLELKWTSRWDDPTYYDA